MCCRPFQRLSFVFSFVGVHSFNSETSSLKLSMLTFFIFEMSLSEASFCLYFMDRECGFAFSNCQYL
jgi:hypothetical protein